MQFCSFSSSDLGNTAPYIVAVRKSTAMVEGFRKGDLVDGRIHPSTYTVRVSTG